jgi:hypothetical protein
VAFEDEYRAYRDAISGAVRILRPQDEVSVVGLAGLGSELARFDPLLVICSRPNVAGADRRFAWVEFPMVPERPTKVRIGEHRYELLNPSLDELLDIVKKTEDRAPREEPGDP